MPIPSRIHMTVYAERGQLHVLEGTPEQHHFHPNMVKKFVIKYPQEEITMWVVGSLSVQDAAGALSNMLRARRASATK